MCRSETRANLPLISGVHAWDARFMLEPCLRLDTATHEATEQGRRTYPDGAHQIYTHSS
jgi:hypothetical protein